MKHSICIIDDSIPRNSLTGFTNDTTMVTGANLKYLVEKEEWDEADVKLLVSSVVSNEENWDVFAFRNPAFFLNYTQNNILTPEIIVFDWDYAGSGENKSEEDLIEILRTNYSLIYIYTKADKTGEVTELIGEERFSDYKHRLFIIKKEDGESAKKLLEAANKKYEENFSYRFGKELKLNAIKAIDEILVDISKISLKQFVDLLSPNKGSGEIESVEFASFVADKFKQQLLKKEFSREVEELKEGDEREEQGIVRKLWAYRLYHSPNDDTVRKGDIIKKQDNDEDLLYFVLSSDCHMQKFWKKNFGFISVVPLHRLAPESSIIKERFIGVNNSTLNSFKVTSLVNPNQVEGITVLPGIKCSDGEYQDYLLTPREITTIQIKKPSDVNEGDLKNAKLQYSYCPDFNGVGRLRVSEPFLSPLVQFIMDNITGYGCPDFPPTLQKLIKASFNNARN